MKLTLLIAALCSVSQACSGLVNRDLEAPSPLELKVELAGNHAVNLSITNVSPGGVKVFIADSPLVEAHTQKVNVVKDGILTFMYSGK